MTDCKGVATPMEALAKLEKAQIDITEYQSIIGSAMYAMVGTRPNLAFSVGAVSQHTAAPTNILPMLSGSTATYAGRLSTV